MIRLLWRRARLAWRGLAVRDRAAAKTSMPMCSSASTPAGRPQRAWGSWMSSGPRTSLRGTCTLRSMPANLHVSRVGWRSSRRREMADWPFRRGERTAGEQAAGDGQERQHAAGARHGPARGQRHGHRHRRMEAGPALFGGVVGNPARPVRGPHVGDEHRAERGDLGADVPGRARRAVSAGSCAAGRCAPQGQSVSRDRAVHPQQLRVARRRRPRRRGARSAGGPRAMVAERLSPPALQRQAGSRADSAVSRRRRSGVAAVRGTGVEPCAGRCSPASRHSDRIALPAWTHCALAMASANRSRRRFLSLARASARRIAAEQMPWSDPIALLLQAGIASLEGRPTAALASLQNAAATIRPRRNGALRGSHPAPHRSAPDRRPRPGSCSGRPTRGWPSSKSGTPSA